MGLSAFVAVAARFLVISFTFPCEASDLGLFCSQVGEAHLD